MLPVRPLVEYVEVKAVYAGFAYVGWYCYEVCDHSA